MSGFIVVVLGLAMDEDFEAEILERLAVFDDEPDINDWAEIFSGALMACIGVVYMTHPGDFINETVMLWLSAAITAVGLIWAGHGLKDMSVKEVRRSIVMLELSKEREKGVDYGLIRDVLLHPSQYTGFLMEIYESAFEDGVLDKSELEELEAIRSVLDLTDEQAASIALKAAITVALRDGKIEDREIELIESAAKDAGLSKSDLNKIHSALEDGHLDDDEKKMLESLIYGNSSEEE
tara:strand:- start:5178 stop:5888 length:711 start_codon:yes stop_codon:yes gene_type:complete